MIHVGITTNPQNGDAEWLEPVDDAYYYGLKTSINISE
jgi:hypothetical protein